MPRSARQQAPRLYPLRDLPRQRTADHVDCDDGSHSRPPCGYCDHCLYVQTRWLGDHPSWMSTRDAQELVCS